MLESRIAVPHVIAFLRQSFCAALLCGAVFWGAAPAGAVSLTQAQITDVLGGGLRVGERNAGLPLWPIYAKDSQDGTKPELLGYVFESIDFEPTRGFSGKPLNLLVAISPEGRFLTVHLLDHKEPLFRSEKGTALLEAFAQQYPGITPQHNIQIYDYHAKTRITDTDASLHGVQGGTVTVKAINNSLVQSALAVARAHAHALQTGHDMGADGLVAGADANDAAVRSLDWEQLLSRHMVEETQFTRGQIEAAFANTRAAGNDPLAASQPDEIALRLHVALVSLPIVGRNLLDEEGWRLLSANRRQGQALWVGESGPLYKMAYERQRLSLDMPFVLRQDGKELSLRRMAYDKKIAMPNYPEQVTAHFLIVDEATPLDLSKPFELSLKYGRRFGSFPQSVVLNEFALPYKFVGWRSGLSQWIDQPWAAAWQDRALEIAVLLLGLAVLTLGLAQQTWLSAKPRRLALFRRAYLVFTVVFIGWMAQGQLSIVNLTAALEALLAGDGLGFFLGDPMTVLLWLYVGMTLLVWGRGTFCGWLCPFGALQELLSDAAKFLGWQHKRLKTRLDARLKWLKYAVLALVLGSALVGSLWPEWAMNHTWLELAPEVEPFKTAISLYFVRDWPFVLWALVCLTLSVVVYRGYCRYICPLGAALAGLNVLQRWGWIARRAECGTPCQTCRHRCDYQAIATSGEVDYAECFQCLECVEIHQSDQQCLPLIQTRKGRVVPIRLLSEEGV